MSKLLIILFTVIFCSTNCSKAMEQLQELCTKSNPCYYENGNWTHGDQGWTGGEIAAVTIAGGLFVLERIVDWTYHKLTTGKDIEAIKTVTDGMGAGIINDVTAIKAVTDVVGASSIINDVTAIKTVTDGMKEEK